MASFCSAVGRLTTGIKSSIVSECAAGGVMAVDD